MREKEVYRVCVVARGTIAFASLSLSSSSKIFFMPCARVNPGEFNTRLNVRERYADLRRQFITHFKADDVENAREGGGEGGLSKEGELALLPHSEQIVKDRKRIIALDLAISIRTRRCSIDRRRNRVFDDWCANREKEKKHGV